MREQFHFQCLFAMVLRMLLYDAALCCCNLKGNGTWRNKRVCSSLLHCKRMQFLEHGRWKQSNERRGQCCVQISYAFYVYGRQLGPIRRVMNSSGEAEENWYLHSNDHDDVRMAAIAAAVYLQPAVESHTSEGLKWSSSASGSPCIHVPP